MRFRTLTRTRYLKLSEPERRQALQTLYDENLRRLQNALAFCARHRISLYRISSGLFPLSDEEIGAQILEQMTPLLSTIGTQATRLGIRVVLHPDQYVVLNSTSPQVVQNSVKILQRHARTLDLFGLPHNPWAAMTIHGGKGGRPEALVQAIQTLPDPVRSRLTLENDERAYSGEEILAVCRKSGIPMVFDAHHHVCHERLSSYDHPTVAELLGAARDTWPQPHWQLVHLSNGRESFTDPAHSDFIEAMPGAYHAAPWIEVEAKAKEQAIARLRAAWPVAA